VQSATKKPAVLRRAGFFIRNIDVSGLDERGLARPGAARPGIASCATSASKAPKSNSATSSSCLKTDIADHRPERRSFLARIIWWRDNFVGVAFNSDTSSELPVSDLEERLRKSEQKKRQLQHRINELLGEG